MLLDRWYPLYALISSNNLCPYWAGTHTHFTIIFIFNVNILVSYILEYFSISQEMVSFIATTEKSPKRGKSTPSFWTEVYVKWYLWKLWVIIDTTYPTCKLGWLVTITFTVWIIQLYLMVHMPLHLSEPMGSTCVFHFWPKSPQPDIQRDLFWGIYSGKCIILTW